jgi:DNA-directed RNA polymerase subunit RPC12/RpoP
MARIVHDWRIDFMRSHPSLLEVMPREPERSFGYPLCEAGWRDILERLCARIEAALQDGETFEFVRIKQKFGILRVDWDGEVSDETRLRIGEAINLAVARSACTCEICGAEGRLYSRRGWLATLCAEHAAGGSGAGRARLRERPHPAPEAQRFGNVPRAVRSRDGHADGDFAGVAGLGGIAMAKFRCIACGREGEFVYGPERHECRRCGSSNVVFALGIDDRIAARPIPFIDVPPGSLGI